jgi:predicted protein tyrosine phosphatase
MDRSSTPSIVVSPYQFVQRAASSTARVTHAVSILGDSDRLDWPNFGRIEALRLRFDDIHAPARGWIPPGLGHITELISFGRRWAATSGSIVVHCRAGAARSPAAAIILAAVLSGPASDELVHRVAVARSYYRPHRGMLMLADRILDRRTSLIGLVQSLPPPVSTDAWSPAWITLTDPKAER